MRNPLPPNALLAIEKELAAAHRALYRARDEASNLADLTLHDDLQLVQLAVERLQEDMLRNRGRLRGSPSYRAYLSHLTSDDGRPAARHPLREGSDDLQRHRRERPGESVL